MDSFNIEEIQYVNKRRWDILIDNNVRLMLSENSLNESIKNFLVLENKLSEKDAALPKIKYAPPKIFLFEGMKEKTEKMEKDTARRKGSRTAPKAQASFRARPTPAPRRPAPVRPS